MNRLPAPRLAIIVPCFNEEEVLPVTDRTLNALIETMMNAGEISSGLIFYVDDGSTDNTWKEIERFSSLRVKGLRLSRHCGHQEALLAGIEEAIPVADACVTIDADLQDDPEAIRDMVSRYRDGAEIVNGVRRDRTSDSWFKRSSAKGFYGMMRSLGVECIDNHADFRLIGSKAMADLMEYGERNLFLRGIVPLLGYRQECVEYVRSERKAGKTKYPVLKMLDFALDGITSFTVRPVRMLFVIGLAFMLTTLCIFIYVLIRHFSGATIEGWTSLILSIWFCTGILLMGMGIIGEYVGKIYIETKQRPRYHISERV